MEKSKKVNKSKVSGLPDTAFRPSHRPLPHSTPTERIIKNIFQKPICGLSSLIILYDAGISRKRQSKFARYQSEFFNK